MSVQALPVGTVLFHGTLERFWGTPRPGGYDGVLWAAESPAVAQSYIPKSGGRTYAPLRMLTRPTRAGLRIHLRRGRTTS